MAGNQVVLLDKSSDTRLKAESADFGLCKTKMSNHVQLHHAPALRKLLTHFQSGEEFTSSDITVASADLSSMKTSLRAKLKDGVHCPSDAQIQELETWQQAIQLKIETLKDPPWYWVLHWMCITKSGHFDDANNLKAFSRSHVEALKEDMKHEQNVIEKVLESISACQDFLAKRNDVTAMQAASHVTTMLSMLRVE